MRELTISEAEQTSGGIPIVLVGLLGAFVGQLMHDAMGGAEGIDRGVKRVYNFFTKGSEKYQAFCSKPQHRPYCD